MAQLADFALQRVGHSGRRGARDGAGGRRLDAEIAPAAPGRLGRGGHRVRRAGVELLPAAGDLGDGVVDVDAPRTRGGRRRFGRNDARGRILRLAGGLREARSFTRRLLIGGEFALGLRARCRLAFGEAPRGGFALGLFPRRDFALRTPALGRLAFGLFSRRLAFGLAARLLALGAAALGRFALRLTCGGGLAFRLLADQPLLEALEATHDGAQGLTLVASSALVALDEARHRIEARARCGRRSWRRGSRNG